MRKTTASAASDEIEVKDGVIVVNDPALELRLAVAFSGDAEKLRNWLDVFSSQK